MNLHAIANSQIVAINPNLTGTWKRSTGYTTSADGTQVPTYATNATVSAQVQALSASELKHLDSLNIQGLLRGLYLTGNVQGVVQPAAKGGDLFTLPTAMVGTPNDSWLVVHVFETWDGPGWSHVAICLQGAAT